MRESTVRVDGLNIRCLEEGQGSPILLLHGGTLGFSADVWRGTMPKLAAAGHRVITYDQPGFGVSNPPPEFGLRYRQDFIVKLLDTLGVSRPLLVGHSQAGGLVVGAVLATPEKFRAVVVMGTGSLLPPLDTPSRDVDIPEREPGVEDTRALLKANLFHHDLITPELLDAYHRMSIGRNFENAVKRARAGGGAKGATASRPLWQRLDEMKIPSLFIYGANDRASAAKRVGLARERFPTLTYHLLDQCHHIIQWDQPDAFVRLTLDFLTSHPAEIQKGFSPMGKIRYLAMLSHQPDDLAKFYAGYFGMKELGRSDAGDVSLTDGYMNLTVFKIQPKTREFEPRLAVGMNHLGLAVDSIEETVKRYLKFNPNGLVVKEPGGIHYGEVRIHDPEFMPISLSERAFGVPTNEAAMPKLLHVALNAFFPTPVMEFYEQVFGLRPLAKANAQRVRAKRPNRFMGETGPRISRFMPSTPTTPVMKGTTA